MNAEPIRTVPFTVPDGRRTLQYTLLSDIPAPGIPGGPLYGIRISLSDDAGVLLDEAEIRGMTPDRSAVLALLDLLIRNTVTPCTLQDVLEDLL